MRSFQVARVFGNLTVRENLLVPFFAAAARRTSTARRQAERMIRLTTLEPLADDPAKKLSGGQRMLLQAWAAAS